MADRIFHTPQTQGIVHVYMGLTLVGQGNSKAPLLGAGDTNAAFVSQPVRTGTGTFTLTTINGYPGVITALVGYSQGTVSATSTAYVSSAQNANGTWTFTFSLFPSGSAADLATTDSLYVLLVMRNSGSLP